LTIATPIIRLKAGSQIDKEIAMLVLTRKEGESVYIYPAVYIDENMTVKELFSHGPIMISVNKIAGQVKLAIDAPTVLAVLRGELDNSVSKTSALEQ
jgi:sRNA-binding carbon storage regulator CsrA